MPLPQPTAHDRYILGKRVQDLYYYRSPETAKAIAKRVQQECGCQITTRMVTHQARKQGLSKRSSPAQNASTQSGQDVRTAASEPLAQSALTLSIQGSPPCRRVQSQTDPASLSVQARKLGHLSPNTQSSWAPSQVECTTTGKAPHSPSKPLDTPNESYSQKNALYEWYHFLKTNTQFDSGRSFAPMALVNEYFVLENLAQACPASQSWQPISRIASQVEHMLQSQNVSLTLSCVFLRKLVRWSDFAQDVRNRVTCLLNFIIRRTSEVFGDRHPLYLLLSETCGWAATNDSLASLDMQLFQTIEKSIRCKHHYPELALITATHAIWSRRFTDAEHTLSQLVFDYNVTHELSNATFEDRVKAFVNISAYQDLAVIKMWEGKLKYSQKLLQELLRRTAHLPILRLSVMSSLSRALYAQGMRVDADRMLTGALPAINQLPRESQRISFLADFKSQSQIFGASHRASQGPGAIWHYYLSGIQSSKFEESMGHWV